MNDKIMTIVNQVKSIKPETLTKLGIVAAGTVVGAIAGKLILDNLVEFVDATESDVVTEVTEGMIYPNN